MATRRLRFAILVGLFILVPAGLAYANGGAPVAVGLFPGLFIVSPLLGIPATVLAAFLERTFVSLGGVQRRALAHSIVANLLSWVAGIVALFFAGRALYLDGTGRLYAFYSIFIVALTICIEGSYYTWALRWHSAIVHRTIRWGWIVLGNVFSALVLTLTGVAVFVWEFADRQPASRLRPYETELTEALAALSALALMYGLWPRGAEPWGAPRKAGGDEHAEQGELGGPCAVSAEAREHAHASVGTAPDLTAELKE